MSYRGDIRLGDTIDLKFTSRKFSTGAPFTLAGSPAVAAYVGNGTTEITAGITLTTDFDSRTGLNNVRVVASSGNGYAAGTNVQLVITAGTVDGISVVGEVIGEFSIENRSALMPTTAGRTLDVSAGGEGGLDWANVGSPTTTLNLSGTSVKTATDVETDTQDLQSRVPAALVSGRMDASVGAMANDVVTSAAVAASAVTELQAGLSTLDAAGVRAAMGLASANLDTQLAAIAGYIDTEVGSIVSTLSTVSGNVGTILTAVDTEVGAIKAKTDQLAFTLAGHLDVNLLAINGDTGTVSRLQRSVNAIAKGTVGSSATTTSIPTSALDPAAIAIDQFKGRIITFDKATTTTALRGQATDITASATDGTLTVSALTTAPASGDTFTIS